MQCRQSEVRCFGNARPASSMTESSVLFVTLLLRCRPHTQSENWLFGAGEIAYDGRQGRCWVESDWLSDCDHSSTERLSSILQIPSSLGFIFALELILNTTTAAATLLSLHYILSFPFGIRFCSYWFILDILHFCHSVYCELGILKISDRRTFHTTANVMKTCLKKSDFVCHEERGFTLYL